MAMHKTGRVEIVDSLTGEIQVSNALTGREFSAFNWQENNWACDCNRYLFFIRARTGDPSLIEDYACSHGAPRFRARVFSVGGALLFDDTSDWEAPFLADAARPADTRAMPT